MFRIGWSEVSITPDKKISLAGQFAERISEYVEKPLTVTAMALESDAPILIADEPTTSLDTINQRKVVTFIEALCAERGLSMLYITHNLGIVQAICDSAIIMKEGRIVEQGATRDLFAAPADPYTRQLIEGTRGLRR